MAKKKNQPPAKVVPFVKKGVAQNAIPSKLDVSASSEKRIPALSEEKLRVGIAKVVGQGTFLQSRHAAIERASRNVSDDDIEAMLTGEWKLAGKPEWDEAHRNWKYRLTGQDIEGDDLTLILTVNLEELTIRIVTKF